MELVNDLLQQKPKEKAEMHSVARSLQPLVRPQRTITSPLRYPGGKRRLAAFIAETLSLNGLRPRLFVEPFAGGASVSLQLLKDDKVEAIALGEKDPLVASFWKIIFNDHQWLTQQIRRITPSLELWKKFKHGVMTDDHQRALACFFLNRTSFSGILAPGAGPLGGWRQVSDYKIDCRFNKELLIRNINAVAELRDRVLFIQEGSWRQTIARCERRDWQRGEVFYYLDPPFYEKAEKLYRFSFQEQDHTALRDYLTQLQQDWLLSYDPAPHIIELYAARANGTKRVNLLYSASKNDEIRPAQELIVTSIHALPEPERLWRSSEEWKR
jgi:DNA adenine methylase